MKRAAPLLLVLAVVAIAGALLRARRGAETPAAPSHTASTSPTIVAPRAEAMPRAASVPPRAAAGVVTSPEPPPSPDDHPVRREDADRLIAEGKILEGVEVFRKVVEADPTAKNHGDFGSLLYRVTAFDEAAIHLQAAAELDPGNADRWIALANVYYRKVDPGAAWKAEKRAREAEPGLELGRDSEGMRVRKGETAPRQP
jgi:Flp pilus assembly protein TadD